MTALSSSHRIKPRPAPAHHPRSSTASGILYPLEHDSRDMAEHPPPAAERSSEPYAPRPRRRASHPDPSSLLARVAAVAVAQRLLLRPRGREPGRAADRVRPAREPRAAAAAREAALLD